MILSSKTRRLLVGILVLLLVDIIWVLSNELTKFLYKNESFDKPFFCTYFKSSLFIIYLLAFAFVAPFRDGQESFSDSNGLPSSSSANYNALDPAVGTPEEGVVDGDSELMVTTASSPSVSRLSESIFVPIKDGSNDCPHEERNHTCNHSSGSVLGSSSSSEEESSVRSVRFNKMAEVREMSPQDAAEQDAMLLARLSYSASMRMTRQKSHHKTARTALMFSILWFVANYLYQTALVPSEAALVTVLSSTSSLFTMFLAALFPSSSGDKFTISKSLSVFLSIGGVALISWTEVNTDDKKVARGIFMALMSAFFYAAYLVLVKRKSETEEKVNIPLFFGFVGLWTFVLLWPLFLILNFSHIEPFELPNRKQFLILFLNGLVGTVLSEALWLWGVFLTSSLIGTLTITLQIPLSMLMDVLIRGKTYPATFYLGSIPVAISVVFVAILLHFEDSDPVLTVLKLAYRKSFGLRWRRQQVLRVNSYDDDEQQESLINGEEDGEDGEDGEESDRSSSAVAAATRG